MNTDDAKNKPLTLKPKFLLLGVIVVLLAGVAGWCAVRLSIGWTPDQIKTLVRQSVREGWSREEVKNWCLEQGWNVIEHEGNLDNTRTGHQTPSQRAGLDSRRVGSITVSYPSTYEVRQSVNPLSRISIFVLFFFDQEGRLIKPMVEISPWAW